MTTNTTHPLLVRMYLSRESGHVAYDVVEMDTALLVSTFDTLLDAVAFTDTPTCQIVAAVCEGDIPRDVLCEDNATIRLVVRDKFMPVDDREPYAMYVCQTHGAEISDDDDMEIIEKDWLR